MREDVERDITRHVIATFLAILLMGLCNEAISAWKEVTLEQNARVWAEKHGWKPPAEVPAKSPEK